ncbi:hypothetical protein [Aestuariivirga sp.]
MLERISSFTGIEELFWARPIAGAAMLATLLPATVPARAAWCRM